MVQVSPSYPSGSRSRFAPSSIEVLTTRLRLGEISQDNDVVDVFRDDLGEVARRGHQLSLTFL
ncbi:MAG TPA: hypothetical protein VEJ84_15065 [Acidimicrobiales bacterium]|nr:hypothetical protein [Acidimicrobiales bacterium]